MSIPFCDLRRQYLAIKEEIDEAVARVLNRGWFILGEEVSAFEEEFAAYCGAAYGVGVGSGTEALHLALLACGVEPGDEVITVPNTAVATVAAIELAGATPVFGDIDPVTYNIDISQVEEKITPCTKVLLPVHLYGQAADVGPLLSLAEAQGLIVVEDAAQAHGTTYKGRRLPQGDVGCFSFYPTKNLGAYGDGGMVITDDAQIAERVRLLRQYGWEKRYISSIRGLNSRLDELQAAILRVKLKHLDEWNEARRRWARLYNELLTDSEVVRPQESSYGEHIYHLYVVRSKKRDELQQFLAQKGISTTIHYPLPIHLMEAYGGLGYGPGSFPQAEEHCRQVLSLPLYVEITEEEVEMVADSIKEFTHE
jgi:dTDP-4-amino-4,6-dideoxygalactose transaminase